MPSQSCWADSRPTVPSSELSGPSRRNTTCATSPTTTVEITAGRKKVERKKRQPGIRSWISQASTIGTTTWMGTDSANSALLRSEVRNTGSSTRAVKLSNPIHTGGSMPSHSVKAW